MSLICCRSDREAELSMVYLEDREGVREVVIGSDIIMFCDELDQPQQVEGFSNRPPFEVGVDDGF